jgi:5-methylcytosine-specific restriction endonuclease McrA
MDCETPYKKAPIPKALREQVWIRHMSRKFEGRCRVRWCSNIITVFDFQCGHNIPESKGGPTTIENLVPICARCNVSMGSSYTIDEWNKLGASSSRWWWCNILSWKQQCNSK